MTSQPGMISFLTQLSAGSIEAADYLEILDTDDTSMAATGTNKKVAVTDLLNARPNLRVFVKNDKIPAVYTSFVNAASLSGASCTLASLIGAAGFVASQTQISVPACVVPVTTDIRLSLYVTNTAGTNTLLLDRVLVVQLAPGVFAGNVYTVDYTTFSPTIVGADLSVDVATSHGIQTSAGGFYISTLDVFVQYP